MLLYWRICMKTAMAWENNHIIQTVHLLLKSSKRFISKTGENSTTLRILHQQPTTTNTLEIVATTTEKHFAHCTDNYTTLCTLLWQLCNNTLPIAVTTLKIAKKTLKHFADCRENSTQHHCWKMQSQTWRELHATMCQTTTFIMNSSPELPSLHTLTNSSPPEVMMVIHHTVIQYINICVLSYFCNSCGDSCHYLVMRLASS